MDKKNLQQLLQKAAAPSNLSQEEKEQLDQWYTSFDEDEKSLLVFRDTAHEELVQSRLLNRIQERLADEGNEQAIDNSPVIPLWKRFGFLYRSVAAVLLLVVLSASLLFYFNYTSLPVPVYTTASTPTGQVKLITLSDGSQVWLNGHSKLKYPKQFHGTTRELYLEGEAFFEVARDTTKPFMVHAGSLHTKVLGTAFNIRSYRNSSLARVSVARGKVAVSEGQQQVVLIADEEVSYHKQNKLMIKSEYDGKVLDWWQKGGSYQFREETLADVAIMLRSKFGKEITITNASLAAKKITASFDNTESLQDVTDALKFIVGLQVKHISTDKEEWY